MIGFIQEKPLIRDAKPSLLASRGQKKSNQRLEKAHRTHPSALGPHVFAIYGAKKLLGTSASLLVTSALLVASIHMFMFLRRYTKAHHIWALKSRPQLFAFAFSSGFQLFFFRG